MYYYEVAPKQVVRAESSFFTYASEAELPIGSIVEIEIGKKATVGVVLRGVSEPSYSTKTIGRILETTPLPYPLVELALWLSDYYTTHLAIVLQTLLPRGVEKTRRNRTSSPLLSARNRTKIVLTPEQQTAVQSITTMSPGSALLHGVTGSGKTTVYIEAARDALQRGKSVIVLVPEISLTSQLVDEFSHHFDDIILTHSRQTEAERHLAWRAALTAEMPRIVIGPRSALFLPLRDVGLIVIDEAHEPSFKQEQSPRYSALRAASTLTRSHRAKLVIGSATPNVADYFLATQSDRPIITMARPAQTATKPDVHLVDMTKRQHFKRHRFISDKLITTLEETFAAGKQALIFHNRRGSASSTLCENCGWQAGCPHCFVPLVLHSDAHHLRCHVCGYTDRVPTSCPSCHHADIIHKGIGTKLIESELVRLFPNKKIMRFDGDSESGQTVEQKYGELYDGSIDLIVGTQVIAKGLDLPHLRTVGVIQADAGLSLPDYTATERTFQLLAQVIGRVGRSHHPTTVVVQSYQPTHLAVVDGLAQNYSDFYARAIRERQHAHFPPFTFLLKLTCTYKTEAAAIKNAKKLAAELRTSVHPGVQILGPAPAFYERQRDSYRWQLVLKSPKRQHLVEVLKLVPAAHWQSELDPMSLL